MLQAFRNFFIENGISTTSRFLVAVSGGIDSVVLAHLCKQEGFSFAIAHCNFHLREEESTRDEKFVRELAAKYGVDVLVENFDTSAIAEREKVSVQEAARDLRYEFFSRLSRELGFDYTLLAHHADDNVETIFMNFLRGTGMKGMKGIPPSIKKQTIFLRPLLKLRRSVIVQYAYAMQLDWAEDSSNNSIKYVRNYFRLEIIPQIKKVYPQVEENLLQNAERFMKIDNFYSAAIAKTKKELAHYAGGEMRMPVKKLEAFLNTSLIYEIIHDFGFTESQVGEFNKLLKAGSGKFMENENYQLIRHDKWIIFAEKRTTSLIHTITEEQEIVEFPPGKIQIKKHDISSFRMDPSPSIAFLDARHVIFPLILRKWKQGDYFYPLGMAKKKKLARFLIDNKISKNRKEDVWVLESGKKILWVVGMRIDHRFRIQPSTKQLFKITFKGQDRTH